MESTSCAQNELRQQTAHFLFWPLIVPLTPPTTLIITLHRELIAYTFSQEVATQHHITAHQVITMPSLEKISSSPTMSSSRQHKAKATSRRSAPIATKSRDKTTRKKSNTASRPSLVEPNCASASLSELGNQYRVIPHIDPTKQHSSANQSGFTYKLPSKKTLKPKAKPSTATSATATSSVSAGGKENIPPPPPVMDSNALNKEDDTSLFNEGDESSSSVDGVSLFNEGDESSSDGDESGDEESLHDEVHDASWEWDDEDLSSNANDMTPSSPARSENEMSKVERDQMLSQINYLKSSNQLLEQQNTTLLKRQGKKDGLLSAMKKENSELKVRNQATAEENAKLAEQLVLAQSSIGITSSEMREKDAKIDELAAEKDGILSELSSTTKERDELAEKVDESEQEKVALEGQLAKSDEAINILSSELEGCKARASGLEGDNASLEKEVVALREEVETVRVRAQHKSGDAQSSAVGSIVEVTSISEESEDECYSTWDDDDSLSYDYDADDDDRDALRAENAQLKKELQLAKTVAANLGATDAEFDAAASILQLSYEKKELGARLQDASNEKNALIEQNKRYRDNQRLSYDDLEEMDPEQLYACVGDFERMLKYATFLRNSSMKRT